MNFQRELSTRSLSVICKYHADRRTVFNIDRKNRVSVYAVGWLKTGTDTMALSFERGNAPLGPI